MMLLHRLLALGFRDLVVCHLDHALRPESAEDAHFVAKLAKDHGLEAVIGRQDVAARARKRKQSLEVAAREARYGLFTQTARNLECPRLFLAHHADDQVETFLLNLGRGSGMSGLGAMEPLSTQTIDSVTLEISRPLLGVWRSEIDAYLAEHRLAFREDSSNTDPHHTRNRLRHELLPLLDDIFGRDVRPMIWRTADILRAEDQLLAAMTAPDPAAAELSVPALQAAPLALQRRQIHAWLKAHELPSLSFAHVESVRALLSSRVAKCNLPGGWHARRRQKRLFLEPPSGSNGPAASATPDAR